MASPFSIFRKKQKVMIAALGVLTMFAFVFIPIIMQGMGGRTLNNPVAVKTTKFGKLHESDMARLRAEKQKERLILTELKRLAWQRQGAPAEYAEKRAAEIVEALVGPVNDEALVDDWLKTRNAEQLGMVISNDAVNAFVEGWTENQISPDEIVAALQRAGHVSQNQFFDMLRQLLLARQLTNVFSVSLYAVTPGQRWDYYNRVKCNATIEAIPLAVANYVKDVDDPSDEELEKFFDEHKDTTSEPDSPEPGFRVPHKIAFEFFKADGDKFAEKVTPAEILARYEKRKEYYDRAYKKPEPKTPLKLDLPKGPDRLFKGPATPEPKDVKKPENAGKPADVKKEPAKTEPKQPAKTDVKEPAKTEAPKTESKAPDKAKDSKGASSAERSSPFMLTSLLVDEKSDEKKAAAAPTKAASSPKSESPAKVAAPPKADSPAKDGTPTKPQSPAAKEQPKAKEPKAAPAKPRSPEEILEEMPAEMKADIRAELAREKIVKIFTELRKPLDEYQKKRGKYDSEKLRLEREKKPVPPPPAEPDFDKLAKEHGLKAVRTGLVSESAAKGFGMGTWMPAEIVGDGFGVIPRARVLQLAFQSPTTFRPAVAGDGPAWYLYWKSEDQQAYVPKFSKVRNDVLLAWKMIAARKLAEKAAQSLAAEANKADKPLKMLFANRPDLRVIEPPKFSWVTLRPVALARTRQVEISAVSGMPMVGEEFMKTVFRLEPGKAGVAFNAPKSTVYVVQPRDFAPSRDVRSTLFTADKSDDYVPIAQEDMSRTRDAWLKELRTSAGLEWARPPDRRQADRKTSDSETPDED